MLACRLVVEQRYSISVANSGDISVRMPQSSTEMDQSPHGSLLPAYFFVEQLVNMLAERLEICRKDLLLGAKTAPMHGKHQRALFCYSPCCYPTWSWGSGTDLSESIVGPAKISATAIWTDHTDEGRRCGEVPAKGATYGFVTLLLLS